VVISHIYTLSLLPFPPQAYVLGAGAAIRNFSPAFGKLMSKEQQLEGEYRQLHSRLRTHAESVAFYGGENREASHIKQRFRSLIQHMKLVLHENWWFGMIQDFLLKYLGATVGVVLIIEPFFSGNLKPDTSTLGRAEMLSNLRYHTSVIISLFQSLGTLSISARKLNRLRCFFCKTFFNFVWSFVTQRHYCGRILRFLLGFWLYIVVEVLLCWLVL
jgi:ABC-type uncharacterized transport system fused permease/ATPase subunit